MENQNPVPLTSTEPSHKGKKVWKIIMIVLASILVILALLAWYGFHMKKQAQNLSTDSKNNTRINISNMNKESLNVLVDAQEQSYTLYIAIQEPVREANRKNLDYSLEHGGKLVKWNEFSENTKLYISDKILKNEYAEIDTPRGILEFLQKYPEAPIGLTWNGGIAFTSSDYTYAENMYDAYNADSSAQKSFRPTDMRADPIHPLNHFGPLLGW